MFNRQLLSIDGYEDALNVLDKEKKKEMIKMLEGVAKELLATGFEVPLELGIPIEISKKMLHCRGLFYYKNSKEAKVIRLSHELVLGSILDDDFETLLDTLRHEVVHYALFMLGKGFDDGEKDFEEAVDRLGISSNSEDDSKYTHYYILDTYRCNTHPLIIKDENHTKSEKIHMCHLCKKRLTRIRTGVYKYYRLF